MLWNPGVAVEAGEVDALVAVDALPDGVEAVLEDGERGVGAGAYAGDVALRGPGVAVVAGEVDALVVVDALPDGVEEGLTLEILVGGEGRAEAGAYAADVLLGSPVAAV